MTQPEAQHMIHSAAEIRRAVEVLAKERTETVLLSWSEQVHDVLKAEGLRACDVAARGGPAERTVTLMLKASNPRLSTMVEFVTSLASVEHDYELHVTILKKPKADI